MSHPIDCSACKIDGLHRGSEPKSTLSGLLRRSPTLAERETWSRMSTTERETLARSIVAARETEEIR